MRTIVDMEQVKVSKIEVESPESSYVRMGFNSSDRSADLVVYLKTEDAYELCQCLKEVVDAQ